MAPSMDGRTFVGVRNSPSGEVSDDTVFGYHEHDGVLWAEYGGGAVTVSVPSTGVALATGFVS